MVKVMSIKKLKNKPAEIRAGKMKNGRWFLSVRANSKEQLWDALAEGGPILYQEIMGQTLEE